MDDVAVFGVGDFGDAEFGVGRDDRARVVDLAAAGGVERGAVENQRWARRFDHRADFGVEVVEKGVVVVEAVGHAFFSIGMEASGYQVIALASIHSVLRHEGSMLSLSRKRLPFVTLDVSST